MERVNVTAQFQTKHPYSQYAEIHDFYLNTLVLYTPKSDYELHLDFHDYDIHFGHNEDGTLFVKVDCYDLDEELFLENNGYVIEQADLITFTDPDVSVRSVDITSRLRLPNSELIDIPDLSLSIIDISFHQVCTKTVTIKAS